MDIVIYGGKYGSTKQYAQWIAQELACDCISHKEVTGERLQSCDTIILGCGLYAGKLVGAKALTKHRLVARQKQLVVFTVGLTSVDDFSYFRPMIKNAFGIDLLDRMTCFHFRGGIDYGKLSFIDRKMMGMMKKIIQGKEQPTQDDAVILESYGKQVDFADRKAIRPLVEHLQGLGS